MRSDAFRLLGGHRARGFASRRLGVTLVAGLVLWGPSLAMAVSSTSPQTVPLFDNLGTLHHPISTTSEQAQRYFDQGLRLTYAFNHEEAIRAFEEAARLDPVAAMA
jgi:hypothetical protein